MATSVDYDIALKKPYKGHDDGSIIHHLAKDIQEHLHDFLHREDKKGSSAPPEKLLERFSHLIGAAYHAAVGELYAKGVLTTGEVTSAPRHLRNTSIDLTGPNVTGVEGKRVPKMPPGGSGKKANKTANDGKGTTKGEADVDMDKVYDAQFD